MLSDEVLAPKTPTDVLCCCRHRLIIGDGLILLPSFQSTYCHPVIVTERLPRPVGYKLVQHTPFISNFQNPALGAYVSGSRARLSTSDQPDKTFGSCSMSAFRRASQMLETTKMTTLRPAKKSPPKLLSPQRFCAGSSRSSMCAFFLCCRRRHPRWHPSPSIRRPSPLSVSLSDTKTIRRKQRSDGGGGGGSSNR